MKSLCSKDNSDFDVDQLCKEITEFFNRGIEIEKVEARIAEYSRYEQNLKEQLGIK